jgi:hypothetical protein
MWKSGPSEPALSAAEGAAQLNPPSTLSFRATQHHSLANDAGESRNLHLRQIIMSGKGTTFSRAAKCSTSNHARA